MATHQFSDQEIIDRIREDNTRKVRVAVTDIDGVMRGKFIHKRKFLSAARGGFGFCNVIFGWDSADVCYDNVEYTGWHTGYPDADCALDLSTYRRVPWMDNVPFFLGDFITPEGEALAICPRRLLRKVVARAAEMGYQTKIGIEYEWFNFKESPESIAAKGFVNPTPLTPGMFGYSPLRSSQNKDFFTALMDQMDAFDVPVEGLHTETGPGVYEAAILYSDALEAADRAILFKTSAKELGHGFGIMPSFMAKWNPALPGCSGHVHQSLANADGENVFYSEQGPHQMSDLFRSYLAGQLALLPQLLPFYAPTINSYKRLVEGMWAPTKVTWGVDNRTVGMRVIPGGPKATRVEARVPGSDANPYLAVAAAVASGLWGIEQGLSLDLAPVQGNGYTVEGAVRLPGNLLEATQEMESSQVARELFGDAFIDHFANTRRWEWRQFQQAVTDWERRRYFEII